MRVRLGRQQDVDDFAVVIVEGRVQGPRAARVRTRGQFCARLEQLLDHPRSHVRIAVGEDVQGCPTNREAGRFNQDRELEPAGWAPQAIDLQQLEPSRKDCVAFRGHLALARQVMQHGFAVADLKWLPEAKRPHVPLQRRPPIVAWLAGRRTGVRY